MAIITLVSKNDNNEWVSAEIDFDGLAHQWIFENIEKGENFSVYVGDICEENEISRSDKMEFAEDVTIVMLPAAVLVPFIPYIVAAVVAVAVVLLMPEIDVSAESQQSGSANNDLTNRNNKVRINERFVDVVGTGLTVPDVLQPEFSRYIDGVEERIGAYVFGRNTIDIKNLSDGENLIEDITGSSAGIYRPYTSPNNSAPFEQIGDAINEPIVGVYQSTNAIGQTLEAPARVVVDLKSTSTIAVDKAGLFAWIISPEFDPLDYSVGQRISLDEVYINTAPDTPLQLGVSGDMLVTSNQFGKLEFEIDNAPEFQQIPDDYFDYSILRSIAISGGTKAVFPELISSDIEVVDTYKIKREKVDRLLFNVYAPQGIYKRKSSDKERVTVGFDVAYYRLDDNFDRIGSLQIASGEITGKTDNSIGVTVDIDLNSPTYVEWYIYRTTFFDVDYDGTVIDVIKLKSAYGLFDLNVSDFGNITMVQTKRKALEQATSVSNPEVNGIYTEMIYKYLGNGVFDTNLSTNTDAMQSLIAKALDPKIGRLTVDDLDLDMILQTQVDNETYYQTDSAGKCSYSFDSLNTSAQEVFFLIANTASVILWREGRVLKSWFERPQSVPEMAFTHRSKSLGDETWNRNFTIDFDGVDFPYIDEETNSEETITYPENAQNPKKIDLKGFRGLEQATWRMLREYNKQQFQRVTVDFTATAEGRFVRPSKLISVTKGTRVGQTGGYIINVDLLTVELSQEVTFTTGDDHYLVLKTRAGGTQTVSVTETTNPRIVTMDFVPIEPIYYGNDELKTEFSFGNEARLTGQLMLPQSIDASDQYTTKITAVNYSDKYYEGDATQPIGSAFSNGFSNGFS